MSLYAIVTRYLSMRVIPLLALCALSLPIHAHDFPSSSVTTMDTSVINFTPQFGIGANLFIRPHQSLFFAVNAIHISNASLGDMNPGVNISTQFRVGYSWWK